MEPRVYIFLKGFRMKNKLLVASVLAGIISGLVGATPSPHAGFSVGANLGFTNIDGQMNRNILGPNTSNNDKSNFGGKSPVIGLFLGYGWVSHTCLYLGAEV